jgi:O-antigen/teichoic acid export membrane protein
VPTAFATLLFPAAARQANGSSRALFRAVGILLGLTTVMYVSLALLLPVVVPALLGPSFEPATEVIRIVCIGLIFAAATSQLRSLMQGWGYLRLVTLISLNSTVLSLIGIVIAANFYGAIGAGAALAVGFFIQLIIQVIAMVTIRRTGKSWPRRPL